MNPGKPHPEEPWRSQELNIKAQTDEIETRKWQSLFEDAATLADFVPSEEESLRQHSKALAKAWEKFAKIVLKEESQDLISQPPSFSMVYKTVQTIADEAKEKRDKTKLGKLKHTFNKFCGKCDNYSGLVEIIPTDNVYVGLLAGALSAVAKAAINHDKIFDSISDSLAQLCDDVTYWRSLMVPEATRLMERYLRELYVLVFEFLTNLFKEWSHSTLHRLISSFDGSKFDELFTDKKEKMSTVSENLRREAERRNNEYNRAQLERVIDMIQENTRQNKKEFDKVAETSRFLLAASCEVRPRLQIYLDEPAMILTQTSKGLHKSYLWQREILLENCPVIRNILTKQNEEVIHVTKRLSQVQASRAVIGKLQNWLKTAGSARIWIEGPPQMPKPSQNTLTAVSIVNAARQVSIPALFYSPSLVSTPKTDSLSEPRHLIHTLIAQLVRHLPDVIETTVDISTSRLESVFQESTGTDVKLYLLQDLRSLIPGAIFCILDGLQTLDSPDATASQPHLERVIQALCDGSDESHVTKLCLTSDGPVRNLMSAVKSGALHKVRYESEADSPHSDDLASVRALRVRRD